MYVNILFVEAADGITRMFCCMCMILQYAPAIVRFRNAPSAHEIKLAHPCYAVLLITPHPPPLVTKNCPLYSTLALTALAYSRHPEVVWFLDPQEWVSQHLFQVTPIWDIPLVKPWFSCSLDVVMDLERLTYLPSRCTNSMRSTTGRRAGRVSWSLTAGVLCPGQLSLVPPTDQHIAMIGFFKIAKGYVRTVMKAR